MFGQQRSQSGPGGLSINTSSANLFGGTTSTDTISQAPGTNAVLGSSKPLFGSLLNTTTAAPSGGLFGTATANQTASSQPQQQSTGTSLFGTSQPAQNQTTQSTSNSLFGNLQPAHNQTAQSTGTSLFGNLQPAQNQTAQSTATGLFGNLQPAGNQQQQATGGLFGGLNKPAAFGTQSQAPNQPVPSFGLQASTTSQQQQQPQKPMFSTGIGQYSQQQPTIPGVRVDLSGLKPTTRFNDLYESVQEIIEKVDAFILKQIEYSEECEQLMPIVESNFEYIPSDVEFCTRKLDTFQQALENDAAAIENNKQLLKHDVADARLSFKTIQSLRMPPQFQQTGLWGLGSTARNVGPTLHGDQEEQEGSMDLISYFAKQADEMDKSLDTFKRNLAEVETYLKGVESSTIQQLQRVQFSRGRDGGQRSADDQVRELAAVLKEFENGILGVARKVGGVRDQVQSVMLVEGVNGGRRRGMH